MIFNSFGLDAPAPVAIKGEVVGDAGRFDTRQGLDATLHFAEDRYFLIGVVAIFIVNLDGGCLGGAEAENPHP